MVPIGSFKISQFKHEQTRFGPPSLLIPIFISGERRKKNPILEDIQRKSNAKLNFVFFFGTGIFRALGIVVKVFLFIVEVAD